MYTRTTPTTTAVMLILNVCRTMAADSDQSNECSRKLAIFFASNLWESSPKIHTRYCTILAAQLNRKNNINTEFVVLHDTRVSHGTPTQKIPTQKKKKTSKVNHKWSAVVEVTLSYHILIIIIPLSSCPFLFDRHRHLEHYTNHNHNILFRWWNRNLLNVKYIILCMHCFVLAKHSTSNGRTAGARKKKAINLCFRTFVHYCFPPKATRTSHTTIRAHTSRSMAKST